MEALKLLICGVLLSMVAPANAGFLPRVPALFVLGDSQLDAGTNVYIANSTVAPKTSPYGETYFRHPTGRFTNGRTIADFLAQSLGLPLVPPYLKPGVLYNHGSNFASGGSGLLESTNAGDGLVSLQNQLEQFHNLTLLYKKRIGSARTRLFIENSVFLFAMGSNDIAGNYLVNSTLQATVSPQQFVGLMLESYKTAITTLHKEGARKIVAIGLGPLGCIPRARVLAASLNDKSKDGCLGVANDLTKAFNQGLKQLVESLSKELSDSRLLLAKPYELSMSVIKFPHAYGLQNAVEACCGAGPFNAAVSCAELYVKHDGDARSNPQYKHFLCPYPSTYLFWDSVHPTEAGYWLTYSYLWHGDESIIEPYNLRELFVGNEVPFPPLPV